jgi:hypothetical protein
MRERVQIKFAAFTKLEVEVYFDTFVKIFASFDGAAVAELFAAPGVETQAAISAYYQDALDRYAAQSCRSCSYADLEIRPLGALSVVATVSWDFFHDDGSVLHHWRQAYFLKRRGGGLRTFASAFVA